MRKFPYKCTGGKLTIGIGRNLDDRGITEEEADYLLSNDIDDFEDRLTREIPWMVGLDPIRQRVLIDMAFNLGVPGLLKFKRTLAAIRGKEYDRAAGMMLDSRWATQVGQRAKRLSHMMATGHIPPELI
jgi:lysozyme